MEEEPKAEEYRKNISSKEIGKCKTLSMTLLSLANKLTLKSQRESGK